MFPSRMIRRRTAREVRMTSLTDRCRGRARRIRKPCLEDSKTVSSIMGGNTRTRGARNLFMSSHHLKLHLAMTLAAIGGDFVPNHQSHLGQADNNVHALRTTTERQKAPRSDLQTFQCTHKMRGPPDKTVKLPAYNTPLKARGSNICLLSLSSNKHRNAAVSMPITSRICSIK
jgi:hypothetical protein